MHDQLPGFTGHWCRNVSVIGSILNQIKPFLAGCPAVFSVHMLILFSYFFIFLLWSCRYIQYFILSYIKRIQHKENEVGNTTKVTRMGTQGGNSQERGRGDDGEGIPTDVHPGRGWRSDQKGI